MVSHLSSTLAEIYLQSFEELTVTHWLENGEISSCRRYVGDVIIFDQNKMNEELIINCMNNIHKYLEFKLTEEENNNITYLDLSINRKNNDLHLGIDSKPTQTDRQTLLYFSHPTMHSNISLLHTISINRMITLPVTEQAKQQEWNFILTLAKNNGSPLQIIHKLKNKIILKTQKKIHTLKNTKNEKVSHLHIPQSTHT